MAGHGAHRRDDRGSATVKVGALVVVLLLAAGAAAAYLGWIPDVDDPSDAVEPTEPAVIVPGIDLAEPAAPQPVLSGALSAPPARPALLRQALEIPLGDRSFGPQVAFAARDLADQSIGWQYGDQVVTPASTLKLLTAATALAALGPEHRFRTTVVTDSPREVVLVGGGDPLLTDTRPREPGYPSPATLSQLAAATARSLASEGRTRVRLRYDTSLFSGPSVSPRWEPDYVLDDVVSPITPLWVDEGREVAGFAARSADPAAVAADRFAAALTDRGVTVLGTPMPRRAATGATELAAVESAPLVEIVQHMLEASDNEAAEVLLRQAAIASGRPGSFAAGVDTMRSTLERLGVDLAGARLYDGSGLSRDNRLSVRTLLDTLTVAASPEHPELNAVATTLPVAGFTGSLAYRFAEDADGGLGVVRAKTGTLTGVHGLAGVVATATGRPMAFVVLADRVPVPRTLDARAQLDLVAATLASCACS